MQKYKTKTYRVAAYLIIGVLAPSAAMGQIATAQTNYQGYPSGQNQQNDSGVVAQVVDGAEANAYADLATHTLFDYASMSLASTGYSYNANSEVQDTVIFGFSGVVHWGMANAVNTYGGAGDYGAYQGLELEVSSSQGTSAFSNGDTTEIQEESTAGNYLNNFSLYVQGYVTGIGISSQPFNVWNTNPELAFTVVQGDSYTFTSSIGVTSSFNDGAGNGFSQVDPTWYLETPAGTSYTTGSGYQIAASPVPEPGTLLVTGLGCAGLILRRRRRN